MYIPNRTATSPSTMLPTMFEMALRNAPSSHKALDSNIQVENVVYAPMNPTATASRAVSDTTARVPAIARNQPRTKLPVRLMTIVPTGNRGPKSCPHPTAMSQRSSAPRAPPTATANPSIMNLTSVLLPAQPKTLIGLAVVRVVCFNAISQRALGPPGVIGSITPSGSGGLHRPRSHEEYTISP